MVLWLPQHARTADIDGRIYVDASGSADRDRWWGAIVVLDDSKLPMMRRALRSLKLRFATLVDSRLNEVKGAKLPDTAIVDTIVPLAREGVICFGYPVPQFDTPDMNAAHSHLQRFISSIRPNPRLSDARRIRRLSARMDRYVTNALNNPQNQHKLLSVLALSNRISTELGRRRIAPRLRTARLYIDEENFPAAQECAWVLKWWFAAALQGCGMGRQITGGSPKETPCRGAVQVRAKCKSHRFVGIQLADIVAQGERRNLLRWL
ncbi:MAG: hypothetical protein O7D29_06535 [Gemmatimonadetes bacterium]|nr:hypothetical protein [Gemmatimonadota bacterium]